MEVLIFWQWAEGGGGGGDPIEKIFDNWRSKKCY